MMHDPARSSEIPAELMEAASAVPAWLWNEVNDGICKLLLLSLDRAPPADAVIGVTLAWVEAICHGRTLDPDLDRWRLRAAFTRTLAEADRWPSPRFLLDRLPARREPPKPDRPRSRRPAAWQDGGEYPAYSPAVIAARLAAQFRRIDRDRLAATAEAKDRANAYVATTWGNTEKFEPDRPANPTGDDNDDAIHGA